jgi:hypothetical protein
MMRPHFRQMSAHGAPWLLAGLDAARYGVLQHVAVAREVEHLAIGSDCLPAGYGGAMGSQGIPTGGGYGSAYE